MAQNNEESTERMIYMRRRQTMVFTIVGAVLAIALFISALFVFHVGGLGEAKTSAALPNYGQPAPCAVSSDQEVKPKYVDNKAVTVRVLNGTKFTGFAKAVGEALNNREFIVKNYENYPDGKIERTRIVFGRNAIPEAYTLASNFTDAVLVMDDRQDKLIDVDLGATFKDLRPESEVPTGKEIVNIEGCLPADQMKDLPKAPEHEAA
ncbi:LytR cell envelope-related transcriptional attenuator [Bifidobacterium dolichotidis]|uniref:LytR cell envelope-related transcriptional attenuator n=1 Tax=Bifidobacterium dolichotidis TaxID=2306976 RepID=A0A430FNW3_9BIFI|nr:LytR C-terminal domain-containing protein [Bifidobacterium dolichotidis]RSX54522.1 LytR cell envelope-related transcriptional attenuator [Bifidobacterium dolichotidis]